MEAATIASSEKGRYIQLDLLRAFAILLVLGSHLPPALRGRGAGLFRWIAWPWNRFGWTGVDLFFVLSGFLIGGLLFREIHSRGRLDVRRFMIRRGFKIWPAYYIFIVCMLVVDIALRTDTTPLALSRSVIPYLAHLQNYGMDASGIRAGHTWSLAVEEHFYLALPLLLVLLTRGTDDPVKRLTTISILAVTLSFGCLALRFLQNWHRPFTVQTHIYATHLRIDSLFFGVMLAYFYHLKPETMRRMAPYKTRLFLVGLLLLSPMLALSSRHPLVWTMGFTLLYAGYGCILLAMMFMHPGAGAWGRFYTTRSVRAIAFLGTYSYSIYLWHYVLAVMPISALVTGGFLAGTPSLRWPIITLMYVVIAATTGILMGKLIEMPALAMRERLFPARARALPDLPQPEIPSYAVVGEDITSQSPVSSATETSL